MDFNSLGFRLYFGKWNKSFLAYFSTALIFLPAGRV